MMDRSEKSRRRARLIAATLLLAILVLALVRTAGHDGGAPGHSHATGQGTSPAGAAGALECSTTVSAAEQVTSAVSSAASGAVVCLAAGRYAGLVLSGVHAGDVMVKPAPGASVEVDASVVDSHGNHVAFYVRPGSSHIVVRGFHVNGAVEIDQGSSFVRIDHNDIHGGWEGVVLESEDCTVPHAPVWSGCVAVPPVTDVTISGNRIHGIGAASNSDDALNLNNWRRVRITGNEIYGVVESGNGWHQDCLQSTFGGSDLVFDHNYEHDNQCGGFFIAAGDVHNAVVSDNLFLRDRVGGLAQANIQVLDTTGLVMRNNTNWSANGDVLRADPGSFSATVDHNVETSFSNGCCSQGRFALTESANLFGQAPWTFKMVSGDSVTAQPSFIDAAHDDYRLASNPNGSGVDWRPADQRYGPP